MIDQNEEKLQRNFRFKELFNLKIAISNFFSIKKGLYWVFIVITLNLVTILVVFAIYVLKLKPKKSDIDLLNNLSLADSNKTGSDSFYQIQSANKLSKKMPDLLKQSSLNVDYGKVDVQKSKSRTSNADEIVVWNKSDHFDEIIL